MQPDEHAQRQEEEERGQCLSDRTKFTIVGSIAVFTLILVGAFIGIAGEKGFANVRRHYATCVLQTHNPLPLMACCASTARYAWSSPLMWVYVIFYLFMIWCIAARVLSFSVPLCPHAVFVWPTTLRRYHAAFY